MCELTNATLSAIANDLGVKGSAFLIGVQDGTEQGPTLGMGMTYPNLDDQRDYDIGTYVGAAVWAARQGE